MYTHTDPITKATRPVECDPAWGKAIDSLGLGIDLDDLIMDISDQVSPMRTESGQRFDSAVWLYIQAQAMVDAAETVHDRALGVGAPEGALAGMSSAGVLMKQAANYARGLAEQAGIAYRQN